MSRFDSFPFSRCRRYLLKATFVSSLICQRLQAFELWEELRFYNFIEISDLKSDLSKTENETDWNEDAREIEWKMTEEEFWGRIFRWKKLVKKWLGSGTSCHHCVKIHHPTGSPHYLINGLTHNKKASIWSFFITENGEINSIFYSLCRGLIQMRHVFPVFLFLNYSDLWQNFEMKWKMVKVKVSSRECTYHHHRMMNRRRMTNRRQWPAK